MRRRFSVKLILAVLIGFILVLVLPLFLMSGTKAADQRVSSRPSDKVFIRSLAPLAQELGKTYGVKPSLLLGQAALETAYGKNLLGHRYHNLYALPSRDGRDAIRLSTKPAGSDKEQVVYYQVYPTVRASMVDYLNRLKFQEVGQPDLYERLTAAKTYKDAATELVLSRYTTDVDYADQLVAIIEKHDLAQYDKAK